MNITDLGLSGSDEGSSLSSLLNIFNGENKYLFEKSRDIIPI
jgi:hypothetical protein